MSGSGAGYVPSDCNNDGAGTIGLSLMDVSSEPLADFFAGTDSSELGSIKLAVQEEEQLVAPSLSSGDNLDGLLATSFSGCKDDRNDAMQVGEVVEADEDKLSDALSVQFDEYLLQFNQVQQQPFGLD